MGSVTLRRAMKVGVFGAGAIGGYVGGRLAAGGVEVRLVGRPAVQEIVKQGLALSDQSGERVVVPTDRFSFSQDPALLAGCDYVLVTVKCGATEDAGRALAAVLGPETVTVSFQNGIHNADRLRASMPGHRVLGGMVPFNIAITADGRFHRGTSGPLVVEAKDGLEKVLVAALNAAKVPTQVHADIRGVLYGKLLFNLNNATNALAGIPLREQLLNPEYRHILAMVIAEGRAVLRAANIQPVSTGRMFPWMAVFALKLPTWIFSRVASAMLALDKEARSSMYDDLVRRRKTEVDELNGEIVRLAEKTGTPAPVNAAIVRLVKAAEAKNSGSPGLSPAQILAGVA